jgi:chemotaxis protein methyltransferase CheR
MTKSAIPSSAGFRILIIDGGGELCNLVFRALDETGCQVQCLTFNDQPLLALRQIAPDLVLVDVSLPDVRGLDLVRRLEGQRHASRFPVIVASDQAELEYELLSVFDFLHKPLNLRRLLDDIQLIRSNGQRHSLQPYPPISDDELKLFQEFLVNQSGLHFDQRNLKILERGLMHRMRALGAENYRVYFSYLSTHRETRQELKKLLGLLTIGETFFFRYLAHFEALNERVIPEIIERNRGSRTLRIWSAGCSTGEEPYSLAILLRDQFPALTDWDVTILATDINKRSLSRARDGLFSGRALRLAEPRLVEKYFQRSVGGFRLDDRIREMVRFTYLNLQTGNYPDGENGTADIDLLFCRNVMIYFRLATTRSIVERFSRCLNPGGYFFLGHAETLINISDAFQRLQHNGGFYYRLKPPHCVVAPGESEAPALSAQRSLTSHPQPAAADESRPLPAAIDTNGETPLPPQAESAAPPPDLAVLLCEADLDFDRENFKTASQKYATILAIDPDHVGALIGQGFICANRGEYDAALESCRRALQLDDLRADAYFLRGLIHDLCGESAEAIGEYRKALLLDMAFVMPHYNLSKIFWRLGKLEDARRQLNNAVRLLEKTPHETLIPLSGGLSRAVFLEVCREDSARYAGLLKNA